jgi:hypothetical protein
MVLFCCTSRNALRKIMEREAEIDVMSSVSFMDVDPKKQEDTSIDFFREEYLQNIPYVKIHIATPLVYVR